MWLGVLVTTSAFAVLTGGAETSRLDVTGTVDRNFRAEYDILVRPAGSRDGTELDRGLVRQDFLSQRYGGLGLDEVARIAAIEGVDVAAPIGMAGFVMVPEETRLDLTASLDAAKERQLLAVRHTWRADGGRTSVEDPGTSYVYVTGNRVLWPVAVSAGGTFTYEYPDAGGARLDPAACGSIGRSAPAPAFEETAPGTFTPICPLNWSTSDSAPPFDGRERSSLLVARWSPEGFTTRHGQAPEPELALPVRWTRAALIGAIDPAAEAKLLGLDAAVTGGRYLVPGEASLGRGDGLKGVAAHETIPLLNSADPGIDQRVESSVSAPVDAGSLALDDDALYAMLKGTPWRAATSVATDGKSARLGDEPIDLSRIYRPGPVATDAGPDGVLTPRPGGTDGLDWYRPVFGYADDSSMLFTDGPFRSVEQVPADPARAEAIGKVIGEFDPAKAVADGSPASARTFAAASALLPDGSSLFPSGDPAGYLPLPPQLLTTFDALKLLTPGRERQWDAPVSAIRVRVSGVTGFDELSQERVRLAAELIQRTGDVDVDIVIGSSPSAQTVTLPAGRNGRPELRLSEYWTRKGVAVSLVDAVDRKSLILFCLVLAVCALFLVNAVTASVRTRRHELAVLAALGWPDGRLTRLVLYEVGLIGVTAGIAAAVVAVPVGALLGADVTWARAVLAVPAATVLCLLAGFLATRQVRRLDPVEALRPPVVAARRGFGAGLTRMSLAGVLRVPGRSVLGALGLAIGVAAVTVLTAVSAGFQGVAQGSVLGEVVSLQVRRVDLAAAVITVLLGVFAVADLVYLSAKERAGELAVLRASGWREVHIGRLLVGEGAVLGTAGALTGAGAGLAIVASLTGGAAPGTTALVVLGSVAATTLACALAARTARTRDLAAVLAVDE
ncbi:hypothetical protein Afil01_25600 [Actinorhabdospora filicis]|uniref:ABC3 transporter permease C-terminal domain-containing protein n=1 Tax=Actinorhabdospora filicis TaxID=1785913 RepID=A0A9W6W987_9ACTN|nr:ABC transporter permease [Actinorhabdospora filicis]GLZ77753.1 hypothetical protein Afil01_25600 [Actinorhabdospora filicis]